LSKRFNKYCRELY